MGDSELKDSSKANVVEGFSVRFNLLLDRARVPRQNRTSIGSRRFDVVPNTFKSWCAADKIPGRHSLLVEIVESLLHDIPGSYNPRSVVAWLLAGDAVPNPFADDSDALSLVKLYVQIVDVAAREGMEFEKLPREVRNLILKRARAMLSPDALRDDRGLQLDAASLMVVTSMLETARTMS